MHTGIITNDTFADVLRSISQKRRQGLLEITKGETGTVVAFVAGKIVDAYPIASTGVAAALQYLEDADVIADGSSYISASYRETFDRLNTAEKGIHAELWQLAITHSMLSQLYGLDIGAGSYYTFKVQMVEFETDLQSELSVGQLLLDLVALEEDAQQVQEIFTADSIVRLTQSQYQGSEVEQRILSLVEQDIVFEQLKKCSLLSEYHFNEAMLNLHQSAVISVAETDPNFEEDLEQEFDEIVAALEESVDSVVDTDDGSEIVRANARVLQGDDRQTTEQVAEEIEDDELQTVHRVSRFSLLNAKLLQSSVVPHGIAILFLLCAIFAPFISWGDCLRAFSEF